MAGAPKPNAVREAIADSIAANLKSYNVAAFCERLGLAVATVGTDALQNSVYDL